MESRVNLQVVDVLFLEWLENHRTIWVAYQALMSGILIGIDKHPGFRPVKIRETWWRCM